MPHEPTAPPGIPIFARVDRFHCECPTCGALIVGDVDPRRSQKRDILAKRANLESPHAPGGRRRQSAPGGRRRQTSRERARQNRQYPYNAYLQTLTCPYCDRVYVVGLLLWTLQRGSWMKQAPADTIPTRRQLAQLRAHAESKWPWQMKRFGDPVNVSVTAPCSCPQPDGHDLACPIHGDEVSKTPSGPPIGGE